MLQGHLALHDVTDVEKLAARALTDALRTMRATLNPTDHEDALAYLIATAWELSLRYDPNRGWSFSKLAYRTLRLRVPDWYRQRFTDTRDRRQDKTTPPPPRPTTISLDTTPSNTGDTEPNRLDHAHRALMVDDHTDRDTDLRRALHHRHRQHTRDHHKGDHPKDARAAA